MDATKTLAIQFLGTGTSAGVPMIGCHCQVCSSSDRRDQRSRTSITVSYNSKTVLIDAAPELRLQAVANRVDRVDAVVFTHAHADHIFGLDDVRRFNTILQAPLPVYGSADTLATLQRVFAYAFAGKVDPQLYRPELVPHEITGPFNLFGRQWQPLPLVHGKAHVLGFRIGDFAYCTDCAEIPPASMDILRGVRVLVIDALRPRPHPTHFSFDQALERIAELAPQQAYFTHLAHDVLHEQAEALLPPHVRIAYDGLAVTV